MVRVNRGHAGQQARGDGEGDKKSVELTHGQLLFKNRTSPGAHGPGALARSVAKINPWNALETADPGPDHRSRWLPGSPPRQNLKPGKWILACPQHFAIARSG